MPLVVLNITANTGYPHERQMWSEPLQQTKYTIPLPRETYNKQWILRSVKAHHIVKDDERLLWMELSFPQLMPESHTHYYLEVDEADAATIPLPSKALRFYPNRASQEQTQWESTYQMISVAPNINFGVHRLDRLELDVIVTAKRADLTYTGVVLFECILEYN